MPHPSSARPALVPALVPALALALLAAPAAAQVAAAPLAIAIDPVRYAAYVGTAVPLRARVAAGEGSAAATPDTNVVWRSSDDRTAWVSAEGVLFFEHPGRVTVTATDGAASASRTFEVRDAGAERVTTAPGDPASAAPGDTLSLGARAEDARGRTVAGARVAYGVGLRGAERAARLDSAGRFTADAPGAYPLLAAVGAVGAATTVAVAPGAAAPRVTADLPRHADRGDGVREVEVEQPDDWVAFVGTSVPLVARVRAEKGRAAPPVVWSTSDPRVAWVDDAGMVHVVGSGAVRITATAGGHRASRDLQGEEPYAERVLLRASTVRGGLPAPGEPVQLTTDVWVRGGGRLQKLRAEYAVWTADGAVTAPRVAVSEEGAFTAQAPGTYTVFTVVGGRASSVVVTVGAGGAR